METGKLEEIGEEHILLYPFGDSDAPPNDTVSVFLECAGPKKPPEGWHACVEFALVISNIHDPTIYQVLDGDNRFDASQSVWGFSPFSSTLFDTAKGHSRPIIEEGSADVTVYVRVLEDPTGFLWSEEEDPFLTAKVVTDDTFARHQGFDLATFDEKHWPQSDLATFRILKEETYSALKSRVAAHFKLPDDRVRLWAFFNRDNGTVRPDAPIPENESSLSAAELIRSNTGEERDDLRLYLDVITGPSKPDIPPGHIVVFLKHFDTSKQTLLGVGKIFVSKNSKVWDLHPIINERMRWAPGARLRLYEVDFIPSCAVSEIGPGMIKLMKPKLTLAQSDILDGGIICFQVEQETKEFRNLETQGLYSNPIHFYGFLQNRVMIVFRPKLEKPDTGHPEFNLVLSQKHTYDTMAHRAGEYLQHDPLKLRFTTTYAAGRTPKAILKRSPDQSIADFVRSSYVIPTKTVILYEKLDVSIVELETEKSPYYSTSKKDWHCHADNFIPF
ncbi:ICP0-binding domain of ubiquitin-specific protease 7-domain-containing protein [Pisolithus marmoratus]|nr:ICP0-binding domain of ubiquitin-specific protease 7-domain-containing protein [Pisolithus marmoratus]